MCRPLEGRPVVIIGAGVAGLTAAVALAESGAQVTLFERADVLGRDACSWMAGGMLAPYCEQDGAEPEVSQRGILALDWWPRHIPNVSQRGSLVVAAARDRSELSRFAARTHGHRSLDADAIAGMEPDLAGRFTHGLWFAEEAHLDPREALGSLADALRQLGGIIELGKAANAGDFGKVPVVDCRGVAARDALPILRGVRGEMLLLRSRDVRLNRPVRLLHPRMSVYIVPRKDGLLMLGATSIESDQSGPVTARSAMELLNAAYALHPALAEAEILEFGVGVRPAFPDNLPHLSANDGVVYFNGLYRHGFLLAPWYAEQLVADMAYRFSEAA